MTVGKILEIALKRMDEDDDALVSDVGMYEGQFKVYLNEGYQIALREFYKPRTTILLVTDEKGRTQIRSGTENRIVRVISMTSLDKGTPVWFSLEENGEYIRTSKKDAELEAVCEVEYPDLNSPTDKPELPEHVHSALADYICYRHLSNGSLNKQAKAQFYRTNFYERMRALRPQATGSVTAYRNLYSATDLV